MADLIAVMSAGELQQLASPDEIYERPANRFVATFVGNPPMNVLRTGIVEGGIVAAGVVLGLEAGRLAQCRAAAVAELGIRPEDLHFADTGSPGALTGEVYVVEPMGNETLVDIRVGGERLSVRAVRGFNARIGAPIGVRFDLDDACFFDGAGSTVVHRVASKRERQ
jgi:multiple sugar transport system ATP-binding protein